MPESTQTSRRVEELDRQIASTVEKVVRDLHQELEERIRQGSEELLRRVEEISPQIPSSFLTEDDVSELIEPAAAPPALPSAEGLFAAIRRVDEASGQAEILNALVEETCGLASRAAFFLIRGGVVRGWGSCGFDTGVVESLNFPTGDGKVWGDLEEGSGAILLDAAACQEVAGQLGVAAGGTGLLVPFVLRGQLAGALYTDWPAGAPIPDLASVQLLTHSASQALETASVRKGGSRALHGVPHEAPPKEPAAPAEAPEATPVPAPEPAAAAAVEPEPPPAAPAVAPAAPEGAAEEGGDIWEEDVEDDEPTVIGQRAPEVQPPPPTPTVLSEAVGQQTVRLDISALQPPAAPVPAAPVPAAPAPAEFELEPEPSEAAGFELEPEPPAAAEVATQVQPPADVAPVAAPASTEVQPPADLAPVAAASTEVQPPPDMAYPSSFAAPPAPEVPVAPPPAAAVPPPAAAASGGATTEVRPPDDLQGPGSAFAEEAALSSAVNIPAGEEALHEEARRLARLLVSEIKLYNEEVIEEGRMAGNIYSRLKEDIDRSRQMYTERIDPRIQEDYFHQELVQRLAGGDPKLLGM